MPGYHLSESDRNTIPAKYICPSCLLLLRDPVQTECGHLYCISCIDKFFKDRDDMKCLACGERVTSDAIFLDNFMKGEVSKLNVHCLVNKDQGCTWEGQVSELENHTSACDFNQVSCPYSKCGKVVRKSELVAHLDSECNYRLVAQHQDPLREDCEATVAPFPSVEAGCLNNELTERQEPSRGDYEAIGGPCPFVNAGCPQVEPMVVDKRKKHMKDAAVSHLTLLLVMVMKLSEDVQNLITGEGRAASGAVASVMEAAASSTAAFLGDSENTVRNLVSHVEGVVEENRDLRQRLREQSERLTSVERRAVSLRDNSNEGDNTSRFPNTDPASTTQAEITRRLLNVENKAADHDILLTESNNSVEDVRRQNRYLQRQLELSQENVRRLERRVESQEDHMLALRNVALPDFQEYTRQQEPMAAEYEMKQVKDAAVSHLTLPSGITMKDEDEYLQSLNMGEGSFYGGSLLWKISDFGRRRSDAQGGRQTSFYSPSFYTGRHGYKMCARIYLNGNGVGKGTHISLFFIVMRGPHDQLLRWPFRQKVTVMILDQDNIEHVIDAFRPDPNSSSFQKPRREMNIASGCPLFLPLSDLEKHAYVRDDTMFVKIIVDISDLRYLGD